MFNTKPAIRSAKQLPNLVNAYLNASFDEFVASGKALERNLTAKERGEEALKKAKKADKKLKKEVKKADKAAAKASKQAKLAEGAVAAAVQMRGRFEELAVSTASASDVAASAVANNTIVETEHIRFIGNLVEGGKPVTHLEVPKGTLEGEETFNGFPVGGSYETEVTVTSTGPDGKVEVLSHTLENNVTGDVKELTDKAVAVAAANPEVANSAMGNAFLNPRRAPSKPQHVQTRQQNRRNEKKD